jgi:ATP-dependent Clp protease adaptor protein ClpS
MAKPGSISPAVRRQSSKFGRVATTTVERPRSAGPEEGLGGNWLVIVLNDDHNTFDHVAHTLSSVIPGVSLDRGYSFAERIHNNGQAAVWTGPREPAELYWEQLKAAGLTMAPLEQH